MYYIRNIFNLSESVIYQGTARGEISKVRISPQATYRLFDISVLSISSSTPVLPSSGHNLGQLNVAPPSGIVVLRGGRRVIHVLYTKNSGHTTGYTPLLHQFSTCGIGVYTSFYTCIIHVLCGFCIGCAVWVGDWWNEGDSIRCVDQNYENLTKCHNLPWNDVSV
jgi:hypothetical protein